MASQPCGVTRDITRKSQMTRTYSELITLPTFEERFEYCDLYGKVGDETFGNGRWINQVFYQSEEWRRFRREIILRDNGCEFAMPGFEVVRFGTIHHLNPITKDDIIQKRSCVFDPENVVLVAQDTHKFIHYGRAPAPRKTLVARKPNDTCPWK